MKCLSCTEGNEDMDEVQMDHNQEEMGMTSPFENTEKYDISLIQKLLLRLPNFRRGRELLICHQ